MRKRITVGGLTTVLSLVSATSVWAATVVWKRDMAAETVRQWQPGAEIVTEKGRNVLRLTYEAETRKQGIGDAKELALAGPCTLRLRLRGENLRGLANELMFTLTLWDLETGVRLVADRIVCGSRIKAESYRDLLIPVQTRGEFRRYRMSVMAQWPEHKKHRPIIYLQHVQLEAPGTGAPYVSFVWKDRAHYRPRSTITMRVSVINPMARAFAGKLVMTEHWGLAESRDVAATKLSLAPKESVTHVLKWKAGRVKAGHYVVARVLEDSGREISRQEKDYGVENDVRSLSFGAHDAEQGWRPNSSGVLYVAPASHTQSRNAIEPWRQERAGRLEFFSWSWCDLAGFVPPEDPYLGNNSQWWLSLEEYQDQIALVNEVGMHPVSYILGQACGTPGYELLQKHPDWFMYTREGEVSSYDMAIRANYERRHEFGFKSDKNYCLWATFDATNREARRFIADQIITLREKMKFRGARWDVWSMEVKRGFYRLDGTEIATSLEEADRLSAESLRAVKDMVARKVPDFTWGYNYASEEENADTPLLLAEKCRNRGWMLDELMIGYNRKSSPFHTWDAYSRRLVEWGDKIRQLGGIYNPWPFYRGYNDSITPTDWLQMGIYWIMAGGRTWTGGHYKSNSGLVGDMSLLAFRYNNTYAGWDLRLQPKTQKRLRVQAPDTVWWKEYVFTNKGLNGRSQDLVHLVQSPVVMVAEEDPDGLVRPPTGPITVHCAGRKGKTPRHAFLVAAESITPDVEPRVQAVPLAMTKDRQGVYVTVPSLLYFKTVVFEY